MEETLSNACCAERNDESLCKGHKCKTPTQIVLKTSEIILASDRGLQFLTFLHLLVGKDCGLVVPTPPPPALLNRFMVSTIGCTYTPAAFICY